MKHFKKASQSILKNYPLSIKKLSTTFYQLLFKIFHKNESVI